MASLVRDNDDGSVEAAQCTPGEGSNAVDMDQQQDGDVYVEDTDQGTEDDEEREDQEESSPRAARGGGLSDYSGASSLAAACALVKTEAQAAAAPAAQLEGAQEETQIQALLVSFNSTGVPQVCSRVCSCLDPVLPDNQTLSAGTHERASGACRDCTRKDYGPA